MVTIYTRDMCSYCLRAKALLENNDVPFQEINLQGDIQKLAHLAQKTGRLTLPQIFDNQDLIGGFNELLEVHQTVGLGHLKED
jgi:glutaredoxin 3